MYQAVPAKIVSVDEIMEIPGTLQKERKKIGVLAKVEILGLISEVNIQLIEEPKPGDFVLVHKGCAIKKIDTDYYCYLERIHRKMWEET